MGYMLASRFIDAVTTQALLEDNKDNRFYLVHQCVQYHYSILVAPLHDAWIAASVFQNERSRQGAQPQSLSYHCYLDTRTIELVRYGFVKLLA